MSKSKGGTLEPVVALPTGETVGSTYTTQSSGVVGVITEIGQWSSTGSYSITLEVTTGLIDEDGSEIIELRHTTARFVPCVECGEFITYEMFKAQENFVPQVMMGCSLAHLSDEMARVVTRSIYEAEPTE